MSAARPGRPAKDGTRVQTRLTAAQRASILTAAQHLGISNLSDAIAILATRHAEAVQARETTPPPA